MSDLEDATTEEQVEEPKKGRGAPSKAATKVKADEKSSDEPPVKRGRGRPPGRKAKPAPKPAKKTVDEDGVEAPPKRRGRPPKAVAKPESEPEDDAGEEDAEEEPAPPAKAKNGKADAKKAAKNGHSDVDEEADQDEHDADEKKSDVASSDSRIKIVVEHCKSCHTYRKKAEEIISALKEKWSGIEVDYNPTNKPRKGAFEFNLIDDSGKEINLWTGLKLGPPRKLKFPDPEAVVEEMTKVYVPSKA